MKILRNSSEALSKIKPLSRSLSPAPLEQINFARFKRKSWLFPTRVGLHTSRSVCAALFLLTKNAVEIANQPDRAIKSHVHFGLNFDAILNNLLTFAELDLNPVIYNENVKNVVQFCHPSYNTWSNQIWYHKVLLLKYYVARSAYRLTCDLRSLSAPHFFHGGSNT